MIAHIKYKGKYVGSLYYVDIPSVSPKNGEINPNNPIQNKSTKKQLTGKGEYAILKRIVDNTKGVIEDDTQESYLKMLPKLLSKDFEVKLESSPSRASPGTEQKAITTPQAFVADNSLPDRRNY